MKKLTTEEIIQLQNKYIFSTEIDENEILLRKQLPGNIEFRIQFEYNDNKLVCFQSWIVLETENYNYYDEEWFEIDRCINEIDESSSYEEIIRESLEIANDKTKNINWLTNQVISLFEKCKDKDIPVELLKDFVNNYN